MQNYSKLGRKEERKKSHSHDIDNEILILLFLCNLSKKHKNLFKLKNHLYHDHRTFIVYQIYIIHAFNARNEDLNNTTISLCATALLTREGQEPCLCFRLVASLPGHLLLLESILLPICKPADFENIIHNNDIIVHTSCIFNQQ